MPAEPPYRRLDPPAAVLVHIEGVDEPHRGVAEGWREDRVKVTWSVERRRSAA